jgi:predicted dehydrogenase
VAALATKPIKIGIIGCGHIAQRHLGSYAQIAQREADLFRIVGVCDKVEESAQALAAEVAKWQGEAPLVHNDVHKMVVHYPIDGCDICTPHYDHHVTGVECLEAGVNIMVEKPFGVTVKASQLMIEAAAKKGLITACAENIRRGPAQRATFWAIRKQGMIGEPRLFYCQHAHLEKYDQPHAWHWRTDKFMGGGGWIMDSGFHFADTTRYVFGDPRRVYATVRQHEQWPHIRDGKTVYDDREDTWMATLSFDGKIDGFWSYSAAARGQESKAMITYGSEGCLVDDAGGDVFQGPLPGAQFIRPGQEPRLLSDVIPEFMKSLSAEDRGRFFPHGFEDGMTLEIYDFIRAIATGTKPEVDGWEALKSKAVCEAIYESAHCGEALRYDDVVSGYIEGYQREINEYWKI